MAELLSLKWKKSTTCDDDARTGSLQDNEVMDRDRKAFYKFHASLVEPWDGPAALLFTDGKSVGATLDRNGLRAITLFHYQRQAIDPFL